MNLTKCKNNHYYDADKFISCPHCSNEAVGIPLSDLQGLNQNNIDTENSIPSELAVTLEQNSLRKNTVGWLVCTSGAMRGESFVLREEDNHIGRASNMDIRLSKEPSVSRESHGIITFDKLLNQFIFSADNHYETVCLNNLPISEATIIQSEDYIQLGDCTLLFIALCGPDFSWNK